MEENTTSNASLDDASIDSSTNTTSASDTSQSVDDGTDSSNSGTVPGDATVNTTNDTPNTLTGDDSQTSNGNENTDSASLGAYGTISIVFGLIMAIVLIACLFKIFEKAGEKGWKAIVPLLNIVVLIKIAFGSSTLNNKSNNNEQFNFDDNMSNLNKFNNDYSSDNNMPNNSFETNMGQNDYNNMNAPEMDTSSHLNSEINNEMNNSNNMDQGMNPNPQFGISGGEQFNNNQPPAGMNEQFNANDVQMGMPMVGQDMGQNMENNMPGPMGPNSAPDQQMPNNMPGEVPMGGMSQMEPNSMQGPPNGQFNNGPMPMPGGPGSKQCPNCHAPVPLNLVVCPNCGANISSM